MSVLSPVLKANSGFSNGMGIKQVISDIPATQLPNNSKISANMSIFNNFKNLNSYFTLSGNIVVSVASAVTEDTDFTIDYKDDFLYNYISNLELKANQAIFKNLQSSISYFRFWQNFYQLGNEYPSIIPTSGTIKNGETSVSLPFELYFNIPFAMLDMQNPQQTGLLTWLYTTINLSLSTESANVVIDGILDSDGDPLASATAKIENALIESVANYQVVNNDYLFRDLEGKPLSLAGVANKIGGLFKVDSMTQIYNSQGNNQLFKLLDTTDLSFKDIFIVFREANTNKRVEGIVDRVRVTNGNSPLVDIRPIIVRLNNMERYKLIPTNFLQEDKGQPDGVGALYGVYRIDTSYFGDLFNGELATNNWKQPQLYFDINSNIADLAGGLKIELYLGYKELTKEMQSRINAIAGSLTSVTSTN